MDIITIGDNCIDVYSFQNKSYPGGNAVNVAVYSKRYGVGASYVGVVGSDENGEKIIEEIQNHNVDVSHIHVKEGQTAVTHVELKGNDRCFVNYEEGVLANFTLSQEDILHINNHKIVHSAISGHCEYYFQRFKQSGMITSFDFSDEINSPLTQWLPKYVDYSFFSYVGDDNFIRDFLINVQKLGCKVAIATLGEEGSIAYDGTKFYKLGVKNTKLVDTMGAGDSFISGFLYGVLNKYSTKKCLELGTENAARTITYYGAW